MYVYIYIYFAKLLVPATLLCLAVYAAVTVVNSQYLVSVVALASEHLVVLLYDNGTVCLLISSLLRHYKYLKLDIKLVYLE